MENVVSLHGKQGDETFMMCPCTEEMSPVTPVVLHDTKGIIITSLVCQNCENSIPVVNGILQFEETK